MEPTEGPVEPSEAAAPEREWNPVQAIQSALADCDPSALVAGFVCIVEWVEEDGSNTMSVFRSPMTPWHLKGLIEYARDFDEMAAVMMFDVEDDDEDE